MTVSNTVYDLVRKSTEIKATVIKNWLNMDTTNPNIDNDISRKYIKG